MSRPPVSTGSGSRGGESPDGLEQRLEYVFADKALLRRALTHSSALSPAKRVSSSYQRLEFLGDRVLGLVVADILLKENETANEGDLSRMLNSVVRKETCALVAKNLKLGKEISLGVREARSGGAGKEAILGDVCEAVIGAIYCDGGLDKAYAFIRRTFGAHLNNIDAVRADAKTTLQEWAQGRGLKPPDYVEVGRTGPDHAPVFAMEVRIDGFEAAGARGNSKKIAEHQAAERFLRRQGVKGWTE